MNVSNVGGDHTLNVTGVTTNNANLVLVTHLPLILNMEQISQLQFYWSGTQPSTVVAVTFTSSGTPSPLVVNINITSSKYNLNFRFNNLCCSFIQ